MKDVMWNFFSNIQKNWAKILSSLEFAYNNVVNGTMGRKPFELDYGYHPNKPHSVDNAEPTGLTSCDDFLDRLQASMLDAEY